MKASNCCCCCWEEPDWRGEPSWEEAVSDAHGDVEQEMEAMGNEQGVWRAD